MQNKIEHLKWIIDRYDHYYDAVNNKGNVYLAFMTFLIGGLITIFFSVNKDNPCNLLAWVLLVLTLFVQLVGIVITLLAIRPYRKSGTSSLNPSNIYFGDVSTLSSADHSLGVVALNDADFEQDLTRQIHPLAMGLKSKYEKLYWSTNIIGLQIVLIAFIALLIITK